MTEPTREQIDQSVRYWRRAPQCLDREMTLPIIAALRAAEEREEREERLREALEEAINLVEPWSTYCDYRAEESLQKAVRIIGAALYPTEDT